MTLNQKPKEKEMSFLDHLEDLRWLIIRCLIGIILGALVASFFSDFIFDRIIFGPIQKDFYTYEWLCQLANKFDLDKSFCHVNFSFILQNRSMEGQISIMIWTSITAGFIISVPWILYQIWNFIKPALYKTEKKYAQIFIGVSSILFFLGVLFGYYVIVPLSINFLDTFKISNIVQNQIDINSYIGLVKTTALATGLVFELPVIIFFLTYLGLVNDQFLKEYRKYALVIILIVAAIVTPPDVISQIIVAIPMLLLYELSIFIAKYVVKNNLGNALAPIKEK